MTFNAQSVLNLMTLPCFSYSLSFSICCLSNCQLSLSSVKMNLNRKIKVTFVFFFN